MAFNKYDNDSSLALGGRHHMDSAAPIIDEDEDEEDYNFFGYNRKERSRTKQVDADNPKVSAFSRRTKSKYKDSSGEGKSGKKGKGGRTKSTNKTPPDSPKIKLDVTPRGRSVRGGAGQVQPSPSGKGGKANYATLLDFSSDEEETAVDEEDADNFLLSKGHLAREKRGGPVTKITSKDFSSTGAEGEVIALNPMVLEETHKTGSDKSAFTSSYPPTVGLSTVQAFPVQFAPPTEAKFPDLEPQALPNLPSEPFSYTKPAPAVVSPPSTQPVVIPSLPPPPNSSISPSLTQPLPAPPPSVPTFPLPSATPFNPPPSTTTASSLPPSTTSSLAFPSQPSTTDASQATTQTSASLSPADWSLSEDFRQKCTSQFTDLKPDDGLLKGETARNFFVQSRLSMDELSKIWYVLLVMFCQLLLTVYSCQ